MGLIMLILIGILPGAFALQLGSSSKSISGLTTESRTISALMQTHAASIKLTQDAAGAELSSFLETSGKASDNTFAAVAVKANDIAARLDGKTNLAQLSNPDRSVVRREMYLVADSIGKLDKSKKFANKAEEKNATAYQKDIEKVTKFIPVWVKFAVALALGFGTMIGWKRIVVTVGEKIGKEHLTYAQGASAELVAMSTIGLATSFGLPVSTTHVLSSGIAGTMAASGSGLQSGTLRNIILAWVLTLPVCVLLGATTFSAGIYCVLHLLHAH
jgi:PiT family inorganic phosphate transporter